MKRQQKVESDTARKTKAYSNGEIITDMPTVRSWAARCIRVWFTRCKSSTVDDREAAYRLRIDPYLGSIKLNAVNPRKADQWLQDRIASDGNTTRVFRAYEVLRAMFNEAVAQHIIERNPLNGIKYPKRTSQRGKRARDRTLTAGQYADLLDACHLARHRLLIRLATESGLRRGELSGLRFRDLHLDHTNEAGERTPYILVASSVEQNRFSGGKKVGTTKNGKIEPVSISTVCADELARYYEWLRADQGVDGDSFVFPGRKESYGAISHSVPMSLWSVAQVVERVQVDAEMVDEEDKPLTTLHGLRATGLSMAQEAGTDLYLIQRQARHSNLKITQDSYLAPPTADQLAAIGKVFNQ